EVAMTNWDLAFARANNARRVLEASGLWPGQIHRVVGYADSEPLVPEDPLADENRRLSILAERMDPLPGGPLALPPAELPRRRRARRRHARAAPPGRGARSARRGAPAARVPAPRPGALPAPRRRGRGDRSRPGGLSAARRGARRDRAGAGRRQPQARGGTR